MSFLSPLFLIGAFAAAVPVVLHLLRREPEPKVPFAAVRLLKHAPVEHTARRRLREWLLLVLRVAALVLLAVAFARPFVPSAASAPARATIVALDRSLSVSAPESAARARDLALEAVDAAPTGDLVGLVAFDHDAAVVEPPTADRARVRAAVGQIQPGPGGTRYRAAIDAAARAMGGRAGAIVVVTDLQAGGWSSGDAAGVPEDVHVEVRDTGAPPPNLAITDLSSTPGRLAATVRNTGAETRDVVVHLTLDEADRGATTVRVPAGGSAQAVFDLDEQASAAAVRLDDSEGIAGDNVRYALVGEDAGMRVALVSTNGAPGRDALYVEQALEAARPGAASPFTVQGVSTGALGQGGASPLDAAETAVLVSTRGLEPRGRERLVQFVQDGGGLLVSAGPDVDGEVVGEILGPAGRVAVAPVQGNDEPARTFAPSAARHPVFAPFGGNPAALASASFDRIARVDAPACRRLARFTSGEAALTECPLGSGRVLLFASDLDGRWNDLPRRAAFVPFLRAALRYLAADRGVGGSLLVGERPADVPAEPGVATVAGAGGRARRVAVNVDPRESDPTRLTEQQFLSAIVPAAPGTVLAAVAASREQEERQRLWRYALVLMLAALVLESFVASRTA